MDFIKLNARGIVYKVPRNKPNNFSKTSRIGRLSSLDNVFNNELSNVCDEYDIETNEFYL